MEQITQKSQISVGLEDRAISRKVRVDRRVNYQKSQISEVV